ncbi:MAG: valine--tRNA ligase, partial [Actinomycetota bacterium]|nr:valine--tRNA ligase [Actinomycetota bacterium]
HHAPWPDADALRAEAAGGPAGERASGADGSERTRALEDMALAVTADVLREVRKAKSQARRPMRAPVERVLVRDTAERLGALALGSDDLLAAGSIERLEPVLADEPAVEVQLAAQDAD